jgi:hypothetical protein
MTMGWGPWDVNPNLVLNAGVDSGGAIAAPIFSAIQDNSRLDTDDGATSVYDSRVSLLGASDALALSNFFLI